MQINLQPLSSFRSSWSGIHTLRILESKTDLRQQEEKKKKTKQNLTAQCAADLHC